MFGTSIKIRLNRKFESTEFETMSQLYIHFWEEAEKETMIPNNTQLKSLTLFSIYFTLKTTYPSDIKIACMTLFIKQVLPRLCNPVFPVSDLCVTFTRQVLLPAFWLVHLFSASFAWISFVPGCGKSYRKFIVLLHLYK